MGKVGTEEVSGLFPGFQLWAEIGEWATEEIIFPISR